MSLMDAMDDALLGVDDDELDYDLEKDEEDALLADDNYEDNYDELEHQTDENQEQHFEEEPQQNEEESDILDIDSNVRLDETEEDFGEQPKENLNETQETTQQEIDDEDEVEEQTERNRFLSERNDVVQRQSSNEIPDTLEKVAVQPTFQPQNTNNQRNGRFQRGNRSRGRGRQNHNNRGSVFGRVGNLPNIPLEGKTVLINPHFRGNVQVSENARLVWDPNFQANNNYPQQRYQAPQMAQVAPFQSQTAVWTNPPFSEPNNNFNHPPSQPIYQESQTVQYNQPPDLMNVGLRPLIQSHNQPPPYAAHQTQQLPHQQQGNFRGRDARFSSNQPAIPPLMINNPPPAFNQQNNFQSRTNFSYPDQNISNQNRPFINANNQNTTPLVPVQPNYIPQQPNFDQPPPNYTPQNQFNQNRHAPPVYDQYNDQYQTSHNQFQSPMHNNQNFPGQNFQQTVNYEPNFVPNQPAQFNHQNKFNQNRQNQHQRNQMTQYNNRTPPKRRSFDNSAGSGDRDIPKKKKRSMEFSNLHEVPTVDMPDTTSEEKEEEDEETKAYRLKIEEQKRLREKILQEKEERRKIAAQKAENSNNTIIPTTGNLITTLKSKTLSNIQQHNQQQQLQQPKQQQFHNVQQQQNIRQQQNARQQPNVRQQVANQQFNIRQQQPVVRQQQPNVRQQQPNVRQQQQSNVRQQQQPNVRQQQPLNIRQQQPNVRQLQPNVRQQQPNVRQQQNQQWQPQQPQQYQFRQQKQNQGKMLNNPRPQNIQIQAGPSNQRPNQQRRIQQSNIVITQNNDQSQQQRIVVVKQNTNVQKINATRRVLLKGMNESNVSEAVNQEKDDGGDFSSFLSNRKVISKAETSGVELRQPPMLDTPIVVVSNLAAGTSDVKIKKLCQGLGPIQIRSYLNWNSRQKY